MEFNEIELIKQAQSGDTTAFTRLMEMHDRSVWQVIYHMLGNVQDTQDLYQDTFLRAFEKIGTFRFASSFKSWIVRIGINLCINHRKRKRIVKWISIFDTVDDTDKTLQWMDTKVLNPDEKLSQTQIKEHIVSAMDTLSHRERAVFVLKQIEGYKIQEIAKTLNCAEGTVKNYLFRATQKMKKGLTPVLRA